MLYRHPKHKHTHEVEERETVRMAILKQAGWIADGQTTVVADVDLPLPEIPGRAALTWAGYETVSAVRNASDAELLEVKGIGPQTLTAIREALK